MDPTVAASPRTAQAIVNTVVVTALVSHAPGIKEWLSWRDATSFPSSSWIPIGREVSALRRPSEKLLSCGLHFQRRFARIERQDPDHDGADGDDGDQPTGRS
jgi:hypothetical protein